MQQLVATLKLLNHRQFNEVIQISHQIKTQLPPPSLSGSLGVLPRTFGFLLYCRRVSSVFEARNVVSREEFGFKSLS